MENFKFEQDEIVSYNYTDVLTGVGRIKGISSSNLPVIGNIYIVEQISGPLPIEGYPFTTFICPEINIYKADK